MVPKLIFGNSYKDDRGELNYNNSFKLSPIKRFYTIANNTNFLKRGWQGHKIEQCWYTAALGRFEIQLILVDNSSNPSLDLKK
jgi:hypothetical protein